MHVQFTYTADDVNMNGGSVRIIDPKRLEGACSRGTSSRRWLINVYSWWARRLRTMDGEQTGLLMGLSNLPLERLLPLI